MRARIEALVRKALNDPEAEVTRSPRPELGHYSTSIALRLAKKEGKNPIVVAENVVRSVLEAAPKNLFLRVEVAPPGFVNFWVDPKALVLELDSIRKNRNFGEGKKKKEKVIVEYSSVNVAKPMHVGHLRNTILGDALANLFQMAGYKVVRWNYIGDWGTQFGKIIAAYKLWGNKKEIEKDPIAKLTEIYVRFHAEAKENAELEARGREEFKKLEEGDKENRTLWKWFLKLSMKEFDRIYRELGVKFDVTIGESFYEKELPATVDELVAKGITEVSEGALIVSLEDKNLPPALVRKSDGASLYLTRDLANLKYRINKYKPSRILYVVGNEQSLAFEQLFAVAEKMGWGEGVGLAHVKYGLVLGEDGKKLSTREGASITTKDVLKEAVTRAQKVVEEKRPELQSKEKKAVAAAVGLGAVKYVNLRENKNSDITFDWKKMLDFSGDSAPYLQYTHARLRSILKKAGKAGKADLAYLEHAEGDVDLIRKMSEFPDAIETAALALAPNHMTNYLYEFANAINKFYENSPILTDEQVLRRNARLILIKAAADTLKKGLKILGIKALDKI